MRAAHLVDDFVRDLRYAARLMARTRGFTAVAVLSLALGIGATAAIFTLFDALLLKPLPVERPDELRVTTQLTLAGQRIAKSSTMHPYRWFQELRAHAEVFSEVLAFAELPDIAIAHGARALHARGGAVFVSDNYFTLLGVAAGRRGPFTYDHARTADRHLTAVLADAFWRREFGSDWRVIGQVIRINDVPFTIVAVAPPKFFGLRLGHTVDVFLPLDSLGAAQPGQPRLSDRSNWRVQVVGRLRPGISDAVAGERLTAFRSRLAPRGQRAPDVAMVVAPLETGLSTLRDRFARPLWVLLAMVALLLFIGCANAATMLVSRASTRRAEIAIRASIGAGRARLLRQLAAESLLLTALAAAAGLAIALWMIDGLALLLPAGDDPVLLDLGLDGRILAFTIAVCGVAALLSTIVPSVHTLRADSRRPMRGRLARPFVVGQLALALVLLVGAGLLTRTLLELTQVDPGFDANRVVLATVDPGAREYDSPRLVRYYGDVLERLRAMPGVSSATVSQLSFLGTARTTGTVEVPGFTPRSDEERWVQMFYVGPDFFHTLGISVLAGRDFEQLDFGGAPAVAAINEAAARRYFDGQDPIGRTVSGYRLVGVARNARYNTLRDENIPAMFVPYGLNPRGRMVFAVRTELSEAAAFQAVTAAIRALDPLVPYQVSTLDAVKEESISQERLLAVISTFFAITALLLVAIGLYGVMAFWVTERTREFGIRVALGAAPRRVLWGVLRRVLGLVAAGTALGMAAAAGGSRLIASLLFGLAPHDPLTVAGAALVLAAVAVLAGYLPARRAARVDAVLALRCE